MSENFTLSDYKLQAYLLANAEEIFKITKRGHPTKGVNQYIRKVSDRTSNQLVPNRLHSKSSVDFIAKLPQEVLNSIVLEVKVFKVYLTGGSEIEVELPHNQQILGTGVYDPLQPDQNVGDPGVQIENIEIVRLGGNPAEIDSNIEVRINLFATSIGAYFVKHQPANIADIAADTTIPDDVKTSIAQNVSWIDLIKLNLENGGEPDIYEAWAKSKGIMTKKALKDNPYGSTGLAYNSEQQRIKLQIGYNVEELTANLAKKGVAYDDDDIADYKRQIQEQTEVYYLNLVQNDIGFNPEDGSVSIQINYVASTGTNVIDKRNDLLLDPYLYEKALQLDDSMCKLQDKIDNEEEVRVVTDPFARGENRKDTFTTPEEKKEALTKIDKVKRRLEIIQANKLINGLYAATLYGKEKFKAKYAENEKNARSRVNIIFTPVENVTGKITGRLGENTKVRNLGGFLKHWSVFEGKSADKAKSGVRASQRAAQIPGYQEQEIEALIETAIGSQTEGDEVNIEFVYFGDIIETAFEVLASNNRFGEGSSYTGFPAIFERRSKFANHVRRDAKSNDRDDQDRDDYSSEDLEVYVTPFYINGGNTDGRLPYLYQQYGEILLSNVTYNSPADVNTEITLRLSDVPISMVAFKKWFTQNISGVRKRHFFIKNYLESLMNWVSKLIGDAVASDDSKTTDLEPPELLINRYFLNLPTVHFLDNALISKKAMENTVNVGKIQAYVEAHASDKNLNARSLTLLGQVETRKSAGSSTAVTEDNDRKLGIPWVRFGKSRTGLLNDINFQREDMPGLREARLFEGKDMNGLNILREKYNSTVRFYGNNFFKPGAMFYIEPDQLNIYDLGTTGDVTSPARALGIGGYHLTIRVTHEISLTDSRWYTTVEGQWQTFGDEESDSGDDEDEKCSSSILEQYENAIDTSNSTTKARLERRMENERRMRQRQTGYPPTP